MSVLGDFYRLENSELKPLIVSGPEVQLRVADSGWLKTVLLDPYRLTSIDSPTG